MFTFVKFEQTTSVKFERLVQKNCNIAVTRRNSDFT